MAKLLIVDDEPAIRFSVQRVFRETEIEAMKRGAYDYLVKQLDAESLKDVVRQACAISELMRKPAIVEEGERSVDQPDLLIGSGSQMRTANVRVIAATNKHIEKMVEQNQFRLNLYYRLRGVTITLPALRERVSDIPELAHYFLFRLNRQLGCSIASISEEAMQRLLTYHWPGNVRELQSVIRESLIRSAGTSLLPEFLPDQFSREAIEVVSDHVAVTTWEGVEAALRQALAANELGIYRRLQEHFDRIVISAVMTQTGNNQVAAAELLGLSRPTLREKNCGGFAVMSSRNRQISDGLKCLKSHDFSYIVRCRSRFTETRCAATISGASILRVDGASARCGRPCSSYRSARGPPIAAISRWLRVWARSRELVRHWNSEDIQSSSATPCGKFIARVGKKITHHRHRFEPAGEVSTYGARL